MRLEDILEVRVVCIQCRVWDVVYLQVLPSGH